MERNLKKLQLVDYISQFSIKYVMYLKKRFLQKSINDEYFDDISEIDIKRVEVDFSARKLFEECMLMQEQIKKEHENLQIQKQDEKKVSQSSISTKQKSKNQSDSHNIINTNLTINQYQNSKSLKIFFQKNLETQQKLQKSKKSFSKNLITSKKTTVYSSKIKNGNQQNSVNFKKPQVDSNSDQYLSNEYNLFEQKTSPKVQGNDKNFKYNEKVLNKKRVQLDCMLKRQFEIQKKQQMRMKNKAQKQQRSKSRYEQVKASRSKSKYEQVRVKRYDKLKGSRSKSKNQEIKVQRSNSRFCERKVSRSTSKCDEVKINSDQAKLKNDVVKISRLKSKHQQIRKIKDQQIRKIKFQQIKKQNKKAILRDYFGDYEGENKITLRASKERCSKSKVNKNLQKNDTSGETMKTSYLRKSNEKLNFFSKY